MHAYIANILESYLDWIENQGIAVFFAGCDFRCQYCFVPSILDTREWFLKDINPPTENFLENIKESCLKIHPILNILIKHDNFNLVPTIK